MTTRELYHTARRALTTVYKPTDHSPKYSTSRRAWSWSDAEAHGRCAVLASIGRTTLPRGSGPTVGAAIRAVYDRNVALKEAPASLNDRLREHVRRKCLRLISERGGETEIEGKGLQVIDRQRPYTLLKVEGWRKYSRQFGARHAALAYLCGQDDNGPWAARVPSSVSTVVEALDSLIPAEVKRATQEGRAVLRQGDVFVIERKRDGMNAATLPAGHTWHPDTRTLYHDDGHGEIHVPFPAIAIQNKALLMGRRTGLIRSAPSRAFD